MTTTKPLSPAAHAQILSKRRLLRARLLSYRKTYSTNQIIQTKAEIARIDAVLANT